MNSINKDMRDAKLLLITVFAYPVDCVCFCDLMKTRYWCLSSSGKYNPPPAAHPPPPPTLPPSHPPTSLYVPLVILQWL